MAAPPRTPVVFVHGLWMHSTPWGPWMDLFRDSGYEPRAPGWPGDSATDAKPIVIGHSFGGLIVQRLLAGGHASAVVSDEAAVQSTSRV